MCPVYLKKTVSYILLTYHVEVLDQLYTPKPNCELFRKSFMYSGAAIWNYLPLQVINATSVNTFKSLYLKWKRPFNYQYYYCQSDSIFNIDLVNDSVFFLLIY